MDTAWMWRNAAVALLLPPAGPVLLGFIGLLYWRHRPRFAKLLLIISLLLIWVLSTRVVGSFLLNTLNAPTVVSVAQIAALPLGQQPQAIVVLGGGRNLGALEAIGTQQESLHTSSIVRARYAAQLAKALHLPVLVSGGKPDGGTNSEATLLAQFLTDELHVPVQWQEGQSRNTLENAQLSAALIKSAGIKRVLLVSHYWHLPRAQRNFEAQGLAVISAPCGYASEPIFSILDVLPSAEGLVRSRLALHERIGLMLTH